MDNYKENLIETINNCEGCILLTKNSNGDVCIQITNLSGLEVMILKDCLITRIKQLIEEAKIDIGERDIYDLLNSKGKMKC